MSELIERLRALARHEHSDVSIAEEAAGALEARTAGEVDGDAIAEVVAYLNGHKTEPAKRMADAVLRLLNRHYQDAAALEAAREDAAEAKQNGYELGLLAAAREDAWLPIETAPNDHLPRLYLCRQKVVQGFVDVTGVLTVQHEFGWRRMRRKPTHWRPLPAPPAIDQARGEGVDDA